MFEGSFYSDELGSLESRSLQKLFITKAPNTDRTVAGILMDTTNWWIDIYAPTNDEMRTISKASDHLLKQDVYRSL